MTRREALADWLANGKIGSTFVYYRGFLLYDRADNFIFDGATVRVVNDEIDGLARMAIEAWDNGKVHLFQRKLHDMEYEYIAMKRYAAGSLW